MPVAMEIFGFFLTAVGLLMLGVTLAHSSWRVSTVHGNVITTNTIFENLWYSCATDSMGVHNCWEFPSMLALSGLPGAHDHRHPPGLPGPLPRHGGAALHEHWGPGALQENQAGGHRRSPTHPGWYLRDGGRLLVRLQHHQGLLRPLVCRNQVRAGPCPLPGLERLPARHPGRHLPLLQLLLLPGPGPRRRRPASLQSPRDTGRQPRCPPARRSLG
ncbi:claudin-15 isoform X2 [Capricornis sumatraensis]|uniref:claudin-15 isoform X2 n=1 Tax=Capricornis sumatraensis TaxID=34865 RepID=UPI00360536ED